MAIRVYKHFPLPIPALVLVISGALAHSQPVAQDPLDLGLQDLPNMGQQITPLAPQGSRFQPLNPDLPDNPSWLAGQAVTTVVSPDKKTMLVLTSGYNLVYANEGPYVIQVNPADSQQYVFIYDITTPIPIKKQVIKIPNTYNGIVFDPSGWAFYVAGGSDDKVHIITRTFDGTWREMSGNALPLHHKMGLGLGLPADPADTPVNEMVAVKPAAAGVAISTDSKTLVVANYYNDSITVFKGGYGKWSKGQELDLRPGKNDPTQSGVPGGEYPFWVVVKGIGSKATAYVSSIRDREIVVANLSGKPNIKDRIKVKGQPIKMTLNAAQSLLYVAEDQSDKIAVIDTKTNTVLESIPVIAPSMLPPHLAHHTGANPNSVTLSPDEKQLYVTCGNLNCISVIDLDGTNGGGHAIGLIPSGWYPNSVSFNGDGTTVFVANGKSPTGPNTGFCYGGYGPPGGHNCMSSNEYNPQLIKAGLQTFPRPSTSQLKTLTNQVAINNRFSSTVSPEDKAVMAAVRKGVRHVIFIIKENRTYDQILGDLEIGNGDPDLTEFGEALTPNFHNLARTFVTLDNFYCTAEVSVDGWAWTTSARCPDVVERQWPEVYAGRGFSIPL